MTDDTSILCEEAAARAFNKQAPQFDLLYSNNTIVQYKRKRVREHVAKVLSARSSILELNAGTGEDAIYFAQQGHTVHATDISEGMQDILRKKVKDHDLAGKISTENCSFTDLEALQQQGPYDFIFSNFAGLNCTSQLDKVLSSFKFLLKPNGIVTLVLLPKFCLWEFLLLFRGRFKTAFRRFTGAKGAKAKIDNEHFRCWYYNPSYIRKHLKASFEVVDLEGLCTIVPPSYIEHFAEKHTSLYSSLVKKENKWKSKWPWKVIGDYYIITLKRK